MARLLESVGVGEREKHNNPQKAQPKEGARARCGCRRRGFRSQSATPRRLAQGRASSSCSGASARRTVLRARYALQSFTDDPLAIGRYGPLVDKTGQRRFALAQVRRHGKDMLVARVEGVRDRNGAEGLKGVELYAPREPAGAGGRQVAPRRPHRLIRPPDAGRRAAWRRDCGAQFWGRQYLEVAPPEGSKTALFPFTKAVAPVIDLEAEHGH